MTAGLHTTAYTSTPKQRSHLVLCAKKKGIDLDALREMCGGSVRALSSQQCSDLIKAFSGDALPHPPGQSPYGYATKPPRPSSLRGSVAPSLRLIHPDHVGQIRRLMTEYFDGNEEAGMAWFKKTYKLDSIWKLQSPAEASKVIVVLKEMHARREAKQRRPRLDGRSAIPTCLRAFVASCLVLFSCSTPGHSPVQHTPPEIATRKFTAPARVVESPDDNLRVYLCWNRVGDDGLKVRNAMGVQFNLVFDPASCLPPRVLDPHKPSSPRPRARWEHIKKWILDWSGPPVHGDVDPPGGNGLVDVDDIEAILRIFVSGVVDHPAVDLFPCGGGDGVVDVSDIEEVLYAFGGHPQCP